MRLEVTFKLEADPKFSAPPPASRMAIPGSGGRSEASNPTGLQPTDPSCWMKWASCRRKSKSQYFGCCKKPKSNGSAATAYPR